MQKASDLQPSSLFFTLGDVFGSEWKKSAGREGTRNGRNVSDDDDRKNELVVKRKEGKRDGNNKRQSQNEKRRMEHEHT